MPKKTTKGYKKIKITLVKSVIGYSEKHKATTKALGLKRINQSVIQENTPVVMGMLSKINHLVKIEQVEE
jgi:large subunit ribosomal protein L30